MFWRRKVAFCKIIKSHELLEPYLIKIILNAKCPLWIGYRVCMHVLQFKRYSQVTSHSISLSASISTSMQNSVCRRWLHTNIHLAFLSFPYIFFVGKILLADLLEFNFFSKIISSFFITDEANWTWKFTELFFWNLVYCNWYCFLKSELFVI